LGFGLSSRDFSASYSLSANGTFEFQSRSGLVASSVLIDPGVSMFKSVSDPRACYAGDSRVLTPTGDGNAKQEGNRQRMERRFSNQIRKSVKRHSRPSSALDRVTQPAARIPERIP
jgi:hypothetical protein